MMPSQRRINIDDPYKKVDERTKLRQRFSDSGLPDPDKYGNAPKGIPSELIPMLPAEEAKWLGPQALELLINDYFKRVGGK